MYCMKCGCQLPEDNDIPLCNWCKAQIAKEEIHKTPAWALAEALRALEAKLKQIEERLKTSTEKTV